MADFLFNLVLATLESTITRDNWYPPEKGWVKLNMDGHYHYSTVILLLVVFFEIQQEFWHVLREQNRLADCIAKVVLSDLNRLSTFENPPDHAQSLFEEDAHRAIVNINSHQTYSS
ncbi:hypothetical protein GOBAR_AA20697 [Gossypium barbadense]|uniref:RNase H type-1 domain-containing protein n=1 Tax=Gossypium barbadense TaxID=3634 RepID=A0A2P5X9F9_GOSBA|nr:hypothetical protein GOBAR_AA20697 [Gossypium barbadense]